jgi:hypothetical protein
VVCSNVFLKFIHCQDPLITEPAFYSVAIMMLCFEAVSYNLRLVAFKIAIIAWNHLFLHVINPCHFLKVNSFILLVAFIAPTSVPTFTANAEFSQTILCTSNWSLSLSSSYFLCSSSFYFLVQVCHHFFL